MKTLINLILIFAIASLFSFCKKEEENQSDDSSCSGSIAQDAACVRIYPDGGNADIVYYTKTKKVVNSSQVIDPTMEVYYDVGDDEYNFVFASGYTSPATNSYPSQFSFLNNYDVFISVIVDGSALTTSNDSLSTTEVLRVYASMSGSDDVYAGAADFNARGGSGYVENFASSAGDFMEGDFNLSMSKWDEAGVSASNLDLSTHYRIEMKYNLERTANK